MKFEGENILIDLDTVNSRFKLKYKFGLNFVAITVGDIKPQSNSCYLLTTNKTLISNNQNWFSDIYRKSQKQLLFFELKDHPLFIKKDSVSLSLPIDIAFTQTNIISDFEDSSLIQIGLFITPKAETYQTFIHSDFRIPITKTLCMSYCKGLITKIDTNGDFYNITILHGSTLSVITKINNILVYEFEYITTETILGSLSENSEYYILGAGLSKL